MLRRCHGIFKILVIFSLLDNNVIGNDKIQWSENQYNLCLNELGNHISQSQVITESIVAIDLSNTSLAGKKWNVKNQYEPGAINLLIPDGHVIWPASCGEAPTDRPTCWSYPKYRQIICNTEMGRYIESIPSGAPFGLPEIISSRYFFLFVLGHEVSHLILDESADASHMSPPEQIGQLRCHPLLQSRDSLEAECDKQGIKLACSASLSVAHRFGQDVKYDSNFQVLSLQAIQRKLLDYHFGDDLCLGDYQYESFSVRVQRVGEAMFDCIDTNFTYSRMAAELWGSALLPAEQILRKHQRWGWPGSPRFNQTQFVYERFFNIDPGKTFFRIDDDDEVSSLQIVEISPGKSVRFFGSLRDWKSSVRVIEASTHERFSRFFLLVSNANGENKHIEKIDVTCSNIYNKKCKVRSQKQQNIGRLNQLYLIPGGGAALKRGNNILIFPNGEMLWKNIPIKVIKLNNNIESVLNKTAVNKDIFIQVNKMPRTFEILLEKPGFTKKYRVDIEHAGPVAIDAITVTDKHILFVVSTADNTNNEYFPNYIMVCDRANIELGHTKKVCSQYQLPELMRVPLSIVSYNPDSLQPPRIYKTPSKETDIFAFTNGGWTVLIDHQLKKSFLFPSSGISWIGKENVISFRSGRLDDISVSWTKLSNTLVSLKLL